MNAGSSSVSEEPGRRKRLGFLRKLGYACLVLALVLALIEGGFRLAGVGRPEEHPRWESESRTVTRTAPDGRVGTYREREIAGAPVSVNEDGFRDWLLHLEKGGGVLRVAALGDSFTFGQGVREEETWVRRLDAGLAPRLPLGRGLQTLNFGFRGANTRKELEILREHVLPYHPDLVVLAITLYNDAETVEHYEAVSRQKERYRPSLPKRVAMWLNENSYAVNYLVTVMRRGRNRRAMDEHIRKQYADEAPGYVEFRESLVAIASTCREREIPLIVMLFPVHFDDVSMNDWSEYSLRDVHEKLKALLTPFPEVAFVDLIDGLGELEGRRIWIEGDRHPNGIYHARVAEILLPHAARSLGLDPR